MKGMVKLKLNDLIDLVQFRENLIKGMVYNVRHLEGHPGSLRYLSENTVISAMEVEIQNLVRQKSTCEHDSEMRIKKLSLWGFIKFKYNI